MKTSIRLAISVWLSVAVFLILILVSGQDGMNSYRKLEEYKVSLEDNIERLDSINSGLKKESQRLMTDSDEIQVKARELGYFAPDEGMILVKGYSNDSRSLYSMGLLLSSDYKQKDNSPAFRISALITGILFFFLSWMLLDSPFSKKT